MDTNNDQQPQRRIVIEVDLETRRLIKVYAAKNGLTMREAVRHVFTLESKQAFSMIKVSSLIGSVEE